MAKVSSSREAGATKSSWVSFRTIQNPRPDRYVREMIGSPDTELYGIGMDGKAFWKKTSRTFTSKSVFRSSTGAFIRNGRTQRRAVPLGGSPSPKKTTTPRQARTRLTVFHRELKRTRDVPWMIRDRVSEIKPKQSKPDGENRRENNTWMN